MPRPSVPGHVALLKAQSLTRAEEPIQRLFLARAPLARVALSGVWIKGVSCHRVFRTSASSDFSVAFMNADLCFCSMSLWFRAQCEVFWGTAVQDGTYLTMGEPKVISINLKTD